jgi:hypothetical protein
VSFEDRKRLLATIEADTDFLMKHDIMDYSLFIAIEDLYPLDSRIDPGALSIDKT